jgi:hypothetical protein
MMAGAAVMEGWFGLWQRLCRRCRECWGVSRRVRTSTVQRRAQTSRLERRRHRDMMASAVAMDRVASSDKESARWSKEGRPGEAPIMVDGWCSCVEKKVVMRVIEGVYGFRQQPSR